MAQNPGSGLQKSTELKDLIKAEARRLGFQLVGITSSEPPAHLEVYTQWLEANRHGEMGYMATTRAIEKRGDPRSLLPGCKSVVVVAMNCLPSDMPASPEAKVAAYAQGEDYHDFMGERLGLLVEFIQSHLTQPLKHKVYVDTGPILERELAQRAGLGWIGKNTCLIHPSLGSHFLLGEVLLDLPLPVDPPFKSDHCGSCTRCIDQCPTACILPDRTIDARRCISYLTIEFRGDIPKDLRSKMGKWVFGCDICQDVCPWNRRFSAPSEEAAFQPRLFLKAPDLETFLTLSVKSYQDGLRHSPLKRPKRAGLLRNSAVAAGNSKREDLVPSLAELVINSDDPVAQSHAVWALGQIGGKDAHRVLEDAKAKVKDPKLVKQIGTILDGGSTGK